MTKNAEAQPKGKQPGGWPPVPPVYRDEAKPRRSTLMARAYELGVEHYELMTDDELIAAIQRQEDALARSLS